ncbi:MAG: DUF2786 domain-containing protein, partial [Verrucomicrobia bacterium]|nr:DUF2786 domain-containing protein [Verrucomicrobiota bacterium]
MHIYSKKIVEFITHIRQTAKAILANEIRLRVYGDRFYDQWRTSYPINIVIYNHTRTLGYFHPDFYELGFHECLCYSTKQQLHNIIRHELAHYITFINYGEHIEPHGVEFRAFCARMGWGEEVYRASSCLETGEQTADEEKSSIFRKIQKLMALASSSNEHEAEQAMIKSQELLLKHNMDSQAIESDEEEKMYLKRILKQKKKDAKMTSIARILQTFFVSTVYNRAGDYSYLEILGSKVNVDIAEYVAGVLQHELDTLWLKAKNIANLKGTIAKNSFFLGLAKGYCNKIEALKRVHSSDQSNALMVIEKKLVAAKAMAYRHLTNTKSSGHYCHESSTLGEAMGKELNIKP